MSAASLSSSFIVASVVALCVVLVFYLAIVGGVAATFISFVVVPLAAVNIAVAIAIEIVSCVAAGCPARVMPIDRRLTEGLNELH